MLHKTAFEHFERLERAYADLKGGMHRDKLAHFVLVAWHLIEVTEQDSQSSREQRKAAGRLRDEEAFQLCQELTNKSKHFKIRKAEKIRDAAVLRGFNAGRYGIGDYGVGEESVVLDLTDGRLFNALELVDTVMRMHRGIFGDAASAAPLPSSREVSTRLSALDEKVLGMLCRIYCDTSSSRIAGESLGVLQTSLKISDEQFAAALHVLEHEGFLTSEKPPFGSRRPHTVRLTLPAREIALDRHIPEFRKQREAVAAALVRSERGLRNKAVADTGIATFIVQHVLEELESGDHIQLSDERGRRTVVEVFPTLQRALEAGAFK